MRKSERKKRRGKAWIKSSVMAQRERGGEIVAKMRRHHPYAKLGGARDCAVAQTKSGAGEV